MIFRYTGPLEATEKWGSKPKNGGDKPDSVQNLSINDYFCSIFCKSGRAIDPLPPASEGPVISEIISLNFSPKYLPSLTLIPCIVSKNSN